MRPSMVFFGFDVDGDNVRQRTSLKHVPFHAERAGKSMFRVLMPVRSTGTMQVTVQQEEGGGDLFVVTGGVMSGSWYSTTVVRVAGWTSRPFSVHCMAVDHDPLPPDRYPIVSNLLDRMWRGLTERDLERVVAKLDGDPDMGYLIQRGHSAEEIVSLCL